MTQNTGSDSSAGNPPTSKPRPRGADRKPQVSLSTSQWSAARIQYESGELTKPQIASFYAVSLASVSKRSARESWQQGKRLVASTRNKLTEAYDKIAHEQISDAVSKLTANLVENMQPWLEKEKIAHIKDSVRRAKARQRRTDQLADDLDDKLTSKDIALIAKADDTFDAIKRRNLGMNDSTGVSGSLSVRVLTDGAAIELTQQ